MSYDHRLKNLQNFLAKLNIDAILVEDPINLYYLTGLELSSGKALISQQKAHLIVDGRYSEKCQKESPFPVLIASEYTLQNVLKTYYSAVKTLAFDSESTSYKNYQSMQQSFEDTLKLIPLNNPIKTLRSIKDFSEIALLKEAAELGSKGFDYVLTLLKEGITEQAVALELEIFWKKRGGKKVAFEPIIAFGANTSMPHYRAGTTKLEKGQPILIDIGVNLQHYHSDMTRMAFLGEPSSKMREIYLIVLEAQQAALSCCRPGINVGQIDKAARDIISAKGYAFPHSTGHGIGLEIHEIPLIKSDQDVLLAPGMVITIEPGIYLPAIGGIRIEDTIVITENGYTNLTNRPKEVLIL